MGDWQPIETAPRDLPEVLVYCPNWGVTTAMWEMHANKPYWNGDVWDFSGGIDRETEVTPTHWMPLPPPPTNK